MPSSTRCLARSRTESGTSSRVVSATHVASRPVGPEGSVGGLDAFAVCLTALGASVVTATGFSSPRYVGSWSSSCYPILALIRSDSSIVA